MGYLFKIKFKPSPSFCKLPREKPVKKIYGCSTIYYSEDILREIIYPKELWFKYTDLELENKLINLKTLFPLWEKIEIIKNA